jgi:hypothetical protein
MFSTKNIPENIPCPSWPILVTGIKGTELENVVVEPSKKFREEIERRRRSKARRCSIE